MSGIAYMAMPIVNALMSSASEQSIQRPYAGIALAAPFLLNGFTDTIFDDMCIQGF